MKDSDSIDIYQCIDNITEKNNFVTSVGKSGVTGILKGLQRSCKCGSRTGFVTLRPDASHYAELRCSTCQRWLKWLPKPKQEQGGAR